MGKGCCLYCALALHVVCTAATGHTAAWTLYSVSQNPSVEAKIVEELGGLGLLATPDKPVPRPIEWDDIQKLTYLNAVIKVCRHASTWEQSLGHRFGDGVLSYRRSCETMVWLSA